MMIINNDEKGFFNIALVLWKRKNNQLVKRSPLGLMHLGSVSRSLLLFEEDVPNAESEPVFWCSLTEAIHGVRTNTAALLLQERNSYAVKRWQDLKARKRHLYGAVNDLWPIIHFSKILQKLPIYSQVRMTPWICHRWADFSLKFGSLETKYAGNISFKWTLAIRWRSKETRKLILIILL